MDTQKETMGFQTEVKQLLNLMIHSLYSNKEIFLRELVSNASDASDKLRFEALDNDALYEGDSDLSITIDVNEEANTITIKDKGIGMNREDVIKNLGTIARSGTAEFISSMSGDQAKDGNLIGQFGVGFYSAFIVAEEVEVLSRKAGTDASEGVRWVSKGEGEFAVEPVTRADRGTEIILHLREDAKEFAQAWTVRQTVTRYSDHIAFPVMMEKPNYGSDEEDKKEDVIEVPEYEQVNKATALWTCSKSELKEEEYKEFYKNITHDFADPLTWSHNKVEGKLEYTSLLYIPSKAPHDLYNREGSRGLKLYVQRVFIMDEAEQFLPLYLRFMKGVVDSNDLSLNVSREILQKDSRIDSMRSALTKRTLDMLAKMAKKDPEKYAEFWKEFGQVLKEGPSEDFANREKILGLCRFATTKTDTDEQIHSLDQYIERMQEGQETIYYIVGDTFNSAKNSPHLEILRKKGIEVLLLSDRFDDWFVSQVQDYKEKKLVNVARGELDLGDDKESEKEIKKANKEKKGLIKRITDVLSEQVGDVRTTNRLTSSPACLAIGDDDMGEQMRQLLAQAGQAVPDTKPIFEINPTHPLVLKLEAEADDKRFEALTNILFDQAKLAEGRQLDDPASYVAKLNELLLDLSA